MLKPLLLAACALASSLFSAAAGAQTTYKCGNSYSQQPCPGGTVIDTADPRTSAQKKQAEQAIQRNAKLASELEKSRLQQEKSRSGEGSAGTASAKDKPPAKPHRQIQKQPEQQPEDFKALAPAEPGKKKPAKKIQRSEKTSADSG